MSPHIAVDILRWYYSNLGFSVNNREPYFPGYPLYRSTLGKLMISLSDRAEGLVRGEVQRVYHGRVGGLSIFFEQLLRSYFQNDGKSIKTGKAK